jgi:hypothetical protein
VVPFLELNCDRNEDPLTSTSPYLLASGGITMYGMRWSPSVILEAWWGNARDLYSGSGGLSDPSERASLCCSVFANAPPPIDNIRITASLTWSRLITCAWLFWNRQLYGDWECFERVRTAVQCQKLFKRYQSGWRPRPLRWLYSRRLCDANQTFGNAFNSDRMRSRSIKGFTRSVWLFEWTASPREEKSCRGLDPSG